MSEQYTSVCTISDLPSEIIEKILKHLDGKSLVVCKRTCKRWRDQVNYLEQNLLNLWFELCQNEIPCWAQLDILDNLYPGHWKNKTCVDWQIIFKCWNFWKYNYKTFTRCELLSSNYKWSGITSIKHSGSWLLISTYHGQGVQGTLSAWNLDKSTLLTIFVCPGMGSGILGFELVNTDGRPPNLMSVGKSSVDLNEFYDTIDHDEIWIELSNSYFRLRRDFIYMVDKIDQKIRHSYGYEMKLVNELGKSVLYLNKTCEKVNGPEVMQLDLPRNCKDILHFLRNKVTLLVAGGATEDSIKIDTVTMNSKSQNTIDSEAISNQDQPRLYTWQNTLFIAFSGRRRLLFKIGSKSSQQEISLRKGAITAALFYSGYLFLGNDRGHLMVYQASDPGDCLDVVVYDTECWTIYLNPNKLVKITHIAVVESKHPGKKPTIICTSPEEIYRISFPDSMENTSKTKSKCAIKEVIW